MNYEVMALGEQYLALEPQGNRSLHQFLQNELTISSAEIALVIQKQEELNAPIPMLLWQYGLVSRSGLERIFDWLENQY